MEDEYKAAGYDRVEITPMTMEGTMQDPAGQSRKVTYIIHEGPLVRIHAIEFDGNSMFSSKELQEEFYKRAPALVKNGIYVEKDVQKAAEFLIEWIKEKGFLSARLITINSNYLPKPRTQLANSSVKLLVYLYEGDQTLVQQISISGLSLFKENEVEGVLKQEVGKPLNLYALAEGIRA